MPDPIQGPLVTRAFDKYATGRYSLNTLVDDMYSLGLRNKNGRKVTKNRMSRILNNPFYTGVIRLVKTGEAFAGAHQPIVSSSLFERVQQILAGKIKRRANIHNYLFSQLIACARCEYSLIGERQKGHTYYRCHTKTCATRTIHHQVIDGRPTDKAELNVPVSLARVTAARQTRTGRGRPQFSGAYGTRRS